MKREENQAETGRQESDQTPCHRGGSAFQRHRSSRILRHAIAIGAALALIACTPAPAPAATSAQAPLDASIDCPMGAFDDFLERFSRDAAFQQHATADPLIVERYDVTGEPEPRRVTERRQHADIAWPVMPFLPQPRRVVEVGAGPDGAMAVIVRTPDTSDQQTFLFTRSPCWQLHTVRDDAI